MAGMVLNSRKNGDPGLPVDGNSTTVSSLARLRQGVYRLFSQSLLYPDKERLSTLPRVAEEMGHGIGDWNSVVPFEEWGQCLEALESLRDQNPEAVQGEYLRLFAVNRLGLPSPPYEAAYVGEEAFGSGWIMAQLEGEYARNGLHPAPNLNESPDHVAVELEFMSYLCCQEAEAWDREAVEEASAYINEGRLFLSRHLGRWFSDFSQRVATNDKNGVFTTVTRAARMFLTHDAEMLDLLNHRFQEAGAVGDETTSG